MTRNSKRALILAAYVGTVLLANVLTSNYGLVPIGFGLVATAGTYAAGAALVARDAVQEVGGRKLAVAGIIIGAVLSAWLGDGRIAIASGIAFLLSEGADMAVYTPLRERRRVVAAVLASNAVGAVLDTLVFLHIAGFPSTRPVIAGQLVGKAYATALALVVIGGVRVVSRHRLRAESA